jgi:hypothetical protein
MKAMVFVTMMSIAGTSLASLSPGSYRENHTHYEWPAHIATANAPVAVPASRPQPPLRLSRTKRQQVQILTQQVNDQINLDDSDNSGFDEVDFQVGYRRPELVEDDQYSEFDDTPLPDHVMSRLAQARALALAKHREKWA